MSAYWRTLVPRSIGLALGLLVTLSTASAQVNQPGQGQGPGQQPGQGQNPNNVAGIHVDASGLVSAIYVAPRMNARHVQAAARERFRGAPADDDQKMVSLRRLAAECRKQREAGADLGDELLYLGGLQRIDLIAVDEEENDILIAGPAEDLVPDATGRMVGAVSGRPPLHLEDLVAAFVAQAAGEAPRCSIDPNPEALARLQRYLAANSNAVSPAVAMRRFHEMGRIVGLQNVTVGGVPGDSHFASILVEADYRMKLIAVELDRPPVRGLVSHLSLVRPGGNSMQRWWFVPLYDPIESNETRTLYRLSGPRAQLLAEDELVDWNGQRSDAATTRFSTERFAQIFTDKFPELAEKVPAFGSLAGVMDLTVLTELLPAENVPGRIDWNPAPEFLALRDAFEPRPVPKHVQTVVNVKKTRSVIIGQITGGVDANVTPVIRNIVPAKTDLTPLPPPTDPTAWTWTGE